MFSSRNITRWVTAALLATGILASVQMTASADTAVASSCGTVMVENTSVTATGPGVVTYSGRIQTELSANQQCGDAIYIEGYRTTTWNANWGTAWYPEGESTGRARLQSSVWRDGDQFTQAVDFAVGTDTVCVKVERPRSLWTGCYDVTVAADDNGNPATPVVVGPKSNPSWPPPEDGGPIDVCGNCV